MAKLTLTRMAGGYLTTAAMNANQVLLEAALENTLSRDGTSPNAMASQLDMNSFRLVNLVDAVNNQEPVTLAQANILASTTNPLTQNTVSAALWPKTAQETSAGVTITAGWYEPPDPRRYGAMDDTTDGASGTDNTAACAAAMSVNELELPLKFRGQVGDLSVTSSMNGYGYGQILALPGSTSAFRLIRNTNFGLWHGMHFQNMLLDMVGDAVRTIHGFMYYPDTDTADSTLGGRNMWTNVVISGADKAIYQTRGNFGNRLYGCSLQNCNYGIFAVENNTPNIMHPGFLQMFGGQIAGSRKAAIYMESSTESINGNIISNTSIQDNQGHGIYLDGINVGVEPFLLLATHFENNDVDSDGTIDLGFGRGSETIRDLMCWDVDHIKILGCPVNSQAGMEFHNTMAHMDGCYLNVSSKLVQDSSSVVICENANLDGITSSADVEIKSILQQRRPSGANGQSMIARIPDRTHVVKAVPGTGVGLYGQTFSKDSITLTGSGGGGTRTAGPVGLYPYYNKFSSLNASTSYVSPLLALVQNKWYMYSFMMRKSAFDLADVRFMNGTVFLVAGAEDILDNNVADNTWVTMGGIAKFDGTSGNCRFRVTTDGGSVPDVSLAQIQLVQFDTQHEATGYFNSGALYDEDNLDYNGSALLSGGALAVDFSTEGFQDQPDTDYGILLTSHTGATEAHVSAKSATGFTITGGTTDTVIWQVFRLDL